MEITEAALTIARRTYREYWDSEDNEWYPNSLGWPSNFDLSRYSNWNTSKEKDEIIVSALGPSLVSESFHLYHLKKLGDSFKITNFNVEYALQTHAVGRGKAAPLTRAL